MINKKYNKKLGNFCVCVSGNNLFSIEQHSKKQKTLSNTPNSFDNSIEFGERSKNNTSSLLDTSNGSLKYEMDEWLTSDQAACYLKVSKKTLLNMVSSGRVPYAKLGRSNRYLLRELQMLLFSNQRGPKNGN